MSPPLNLSARLLAAARRGKVAPGAIRSAAAPLRYTPFRARSLCDETRSGPETSQRQFGHSLTEPLISVTKADLTPTKMPMTPTSADDTDTTGYSIDHLISQNGEWADANADWFKRHGHEKHAPKYLWIGCSDARTPANEILGEGPNAVFVHRNIANLVVNSDMNMLSVLQYAVNVLCVPHIIVCGHYDCGGVRASLSRSHLDSRDLGSPLEDWLRNIRDVQRLHAEELTAIKDPEQKVRRVVELNVIEQCLNIYKTGVVQRRRLLTSSVKSTFPQPRVHALVYNPLDGRLKQLDLDMRRYRSEMQAHYDIFAA